MHKSAFIHTQTRALLMQTRSHTHTGEEGESVRVKTCTVPRTLEHEKRVDVWLNASELISAELAPLRTYIHIFIDI